MPLALLLLRSKWIYISLAMLTLCSSILILKRQLTSISLQLKQSNALIAAQDLQLTALKASITSQNNGIEQLKLAGDAATRRVALVSQENTRLGLEYAKEKTRVEIAAIPVNDAEALRWVSEEAQRVARGW